MRKTFIPFVIAVVSLVSISSCKDWIGKTGKGEIVTETRTAIGFQSVELRTSANVTIEKSDTFIVEVSDYGNIIEHVSVKVVSNKLLIETDPVSVILNNSQAHIRIVMPDSLISVAITGSGDITLEAAFKDLRTLIVTGSGNINATQDLDIASLEATVNGSGNITAQGRVKALKTLLSGSGNIVFGNLVAETADCTISGSGNTRVHVTGTLKALITGSGNIEYLGSPVVTEETPGSGVVKPG